MNLTVTKVLIATFSAALVIFFERAFPFLLFSKKEPPAIIQFIEKYIPPMVMACLLFYCMKDVELSFSSGANGFVPYFSGVLVTVLLHLWKRNSLLSIFFGTAVYMVLIRFL